MNEKKIYEYLSSAESGDLEAQSELCQLFYDDKEIVKALPDDFWVEVDRIAQDGKDYANFIMHCRYFDDPSQSSKSYDFIRKAIRHKDVPLAVLRLGISYAQGIGTKENHALANYYFERALILGCQEAACYINHEYDTGRRDLVRDVEKNLNYIDLPNPQIFRFLRKRIEKERIKKNYGILSKIQDYLHYFYRDHDPDQGIDDILNDRDTVDADLCYATSTPSNQFEVDVDLLDSMLEQLFAPITQNQELYQAIIEHGYADLVEGGDRDLLQCIVNLKSSYEIICERYDVEEKELAIMDPTNLLPYIKVGWMTLVRRQAFRCVLSIQDVDPLTEEQFLSHLDSEEQQLNLCEEINDKDLQLFLISYVELNIDIDTIMLGLHSLLTSCKNHQLDDLAKHLNGFVGRLTDAGIEHQLPRFTSENLPPIEINN